MENNKTIYGKVLFSWIVPEYVMHERSRIWYIVASIIALVFLIYSFFTANFLFAVIIIITALIVIIHDGQKPARVKISITDAGVLVGKKFYDYDEFKNFAIVDKSHYDVKNLYFEFKSAVRQRLSIPLENMNSGEVKKELLKRVTLDKERTDIPISEELARLLKL